MSGKKHKKLRKLVKNIMEKHGMSEELAKNRIKLAKKAFKAGMLTICMMLVANTAFSDKLIIPFDCYPKEIQAKFADTGRKLDLSGNDRTQDSWGFIVNEGTNYTIYTYKSASDEDLRVVMSISKWGNNG